MSAGTRDTSMAANRSVKSLKEGMRDRLLRVIRLASLGLTVDELESVTGLPHQTASPRVNELAKSGQIVDSGQRRPTRSGRNAVVWVAAKNA